ncbi:hypothetical protein [Bradyrhizobium sp. SEMIA]|uniref:hypothetical protein n=1 Tax=Bradyrhizobium sp. SEMIA TaxID=2597515 RepID=UPI0018A586E2|nr:hypothetical protein [Bradyrhizobium sp. SEMIA]QOG20576.1 hypothetical protein FOM02_27715 [Bradyrhizobium sp. SEMIA]
MPEAIRCALTGSMIDYRPYDAPLGSNFACDQGREMHMRFKPEQHFKMADRLSWQAFDEPDLNRRRRLESLARVFRRLAVNAYIPTDVGMKRRDWSEFDVEAGFVGFIDPPSPWDTLEEWQSYVENLEQLPPSRHMRLLLEEAEETIVKKKLGLL